MSNQVAVMLIDSYWIGASIHLESVFRSQDVRLYRIVSAIISSTDESPAFPALTDKDVDLTRWGQSVKKAT